MKYIHLFVSSLALSFCSCSEAFDGSSYELELSQESETINISENGSINSLPVVTRNTWTLKEQVEQTFNIFGLEKENVADNEPELAGIMRLAWIGHDPFLFFAALMEEVACEKKLYEVILRPLIKHLFYKFRSFNLQEQRKYLNYLKIEREEGSIVIFDLERNSLAAICVKHGHFDLLFELFKDEHFEIVRHFLASSENRDSFFEFFRNNSEYVDQFLNALITYQNETFDNSVVVWIAGCIIKNLPQSYYENKMKTVNAVISEWMIDILFFSTNVPESEYYRIHAQVLKLFEIYSSEMGIDPNFATFLRIINDIRFGYFDLSDFQAVDFDFIHEHPRIRQIAKAALLANKMDLFLAICAKLEQKDWESNLRQILSFENLNVFDFQAKNFKLIFGLIRSGSDIFKNEFLIYSLVLNFYAIKHLRLEGDLFTFEFVASENLLELGFPPELRIQKLKSSADWRIEDILSHMEIFNETAINTFIPDLIEYFKILSNRGIVLKATYKFIEFISTLPNLLIIMLENGMRLKIASNIETLEKYFNLDNFELTSQIIQWTGLDEWKLTKLKTQDHLEKMEKLQKATVGESFLQWESFFIENRTSLLFRLGVLKKEDVKVKYLEWRSVFAYWIKGSDKERIKEIKTPEFIEMLKLDFPNEASELFESEQS